MAVEHGKNFEKVKNYYDKGLWNIDKVWNVVGRWITEAEYEEITGYVYPAKEQEGETVIAIICVLGVSVLSTLVVVSAILIGAKRVKEDMRYI